MPKRSQTRITKRLVDGLQPGHTLWDSEVRGFGVRCQKTDRVYLVRYYEKKRANQVWVTIGKHGSPWTVELARKEAQSILMDAYRGLDPGQRRKKLAGAQTVAGLCQRYLTEHADPHKKPRSAESDRKNIQNHIIPLLGDLPIEAVKREDIDRFKGDVSSGKTAPSDAEAKRLSQRGGRVVTGGRGVANRCVTLLSKMFNLAEDWELRPQNTNPARRIQKFPERRRERFLSAEEFKRLGKALNDAGKDGESPFVIAALRLLIYTGARLSEILTLRWEWVDLEHMLLLLPDSKTGQKAIRLSTPAAELLRSLPRLAGNPSVLPGNRNGRSLVNIQKPWRRIRQQAGIPDVRIHDLRHSFASLAVGSGLSLPIVGALLGHARSSTTERYAHLQKDHLSKANEDLGTVLSAFLRQER